MANIGTQSTRREIRLICERIDELIGQGLKPKEIQNRLQISRDRYFRYKRRIDEKATKKILDPTLKNLKPLKSINKTLNPIQFCDKYLPIKPKPMQRLMLKAFYNLPLEKNEEKLLKQMARQGRTTWQPGRKYRELILVVGMKGGKTTLAALIEQIEEYELFKVGDICGHYGFIPGERIYIRNVATNEKQAEKTIWAKTKASIERSPYFKSRNPKEGKSSYHFQDTNVYIESGHSNSSSMVGDTCKFIGFDELDRFRTSDGAYSAEKVYEALSKNVDPFKEEGRLATISSLVHAKGYLVHLFELSRTVENMLGFWMAEWDMQPDLYGGRVFFHGKIPIPVEHLNAYKKNPEKFLRDKGSILGYTRGKYYRQPDKVKDFFLNSHNEGYRNPIDRDGRYDKNFKATDGHKYYMHHDPASSHCSYAIALGHKENDIVIIDMIYRFTPPSEGGEIDTEEIKTFTKEIIEKFPGVELITYDTWAATDCMQMLEKKGYKRENLYVKKTQQDILKEKIYSYQIRCHRYPKLEEEILDLELSGETVDHPTNGSKDCADAVAAVTWHCTHGMESPPAAGVTQSNEEEEEAKTRFRSRRISGRRKSIWERSLD